MNPPSAPDRNADVPPWDRETSLPLARRQVDHRVALLAESDHPVHWLAIGDKPADQLDVISGLGPAPIVGSRMVLWTWPVEELARLSDLLQSEGGVLVFVEPTAGLGLRRAVQLLAGSLLSRTRGHHYRRDVPQELRTAGFVVTTQVRLRDRLVGDYVRGEARHFGGTAS